jgi:hypothetical protein
MAAKLIIGKRGEELKKNCSPHLGRIAEPPNIFLEKNHHPMTISSTFSSY